MAARRRGWEALGGAGLTRRSGVQGRIGQIAHSAGRSRAATDGGTILVSPR